MDFVEWRYFQWPWVTTTSHHIFRHFSPFVSSLLVKLETSNLTGKLIVAISAISPMTKNIWKGHGQVTWLISNWTTTVVRSPEPFKFGWAPTISLERLSLETSNFIHILAYGWQVTPKKTWLGSHGPFQFRCPHSYLRNGWSESRPIVVCRQNISGASLGMTDYTLIGMVTVTITWPAFLIYPYHMFGIGEARHFQFRMLIDTEVY